MKRAYSEAVYERACAVIPGGVNSPVRSFKHLGMPPLIVESGAADLIRDVDGNEYIDFCGSWGSLILGHAHPQVVQAVIDQIKKGSSFGIATETEEQIAAKIVGLLPSVEKIRFVNSGTEAAMTAMRLARGYTEKPKILKFAGHYHGHTDSLLIQAGSGVASLNPLATSKGVNRSTIADTLCFPFNDFQSIRSFFRESPLAKEIAAVILEPVAGNMGVVPPEKGFLEMLREETARIGALLIFDEVITGFRVGLTGAQGLYGIDPDLTCLGKIIGGGFPVAAVGGKAKIMDCLAPLGQVYQAGTLSGNPVAMRAGLITLELIEQKGFYTDLEQKTARFAAALAEENISLSRVGSMFNIFFKDEKKFVSFFKYLFERGIYISPSSQETWFMSSVHTDDHIDYAAKTICTFIGENL